MPYFWSRAVGQTQAKQNAPGLEQEKIYIYDLWIVVDSKLCCRSCRSKLKIRYILHQPPACPAPKGARCIHSNRELVGDRAKEDRGSVMGGRIEEGHPYSFAVFLLVLPLSVKTATKKTGKARKPRKRFSSFSPFSRFRGFRRFRRFRADAGCGVRENRELCQIQALCFRRFPVFAVFAFSRGLPPHHRGPRHTFRMHRI